jgi:uncharacterized protein (TIGR03437 family)
VGPDVCVAQWRRLEDHEMKYHFATFWIIAAGVIGCGAVHAQPAPAVIPFADGLSIQAGSLAEVTIFVRQGNNTYVGLRVSTTPPYPLLSSATVAAQLLSEGLANLFAAPAGPSGVGRASQFVAAVDLNNGGSPGAAVARGGSTVAVYQLTGSPQSVSYNVGQDVNSVFVADFNGDGLPDLAVAYDGNGGPGGIAILLNKGNGTLASAVTYASGTQATNFAVLDLNHDGFLDIAMVSLDQKVTVVLGKGDGTFGPAVQYTVGGSGQAIAIADFNGDGNPDIAVGGTTGILLGNGDGTFRAGSPLPAGASGSLIWTFAAGDLNGDGKVDLVYADTENQVVVPLFGNGDGTFQPGPAYAVSQLPTSLLLADYNNDGRLDIINGNGDERFFGASISTGNVDILLNNGDGTFQGAPTYFTLPNSEANGSFTLLNGIAIANFGGPSPGVLASGGGGLTLFIGNGKGGFEAPQSIALQGGAGGIAAADFNGDGLPDAAVITGSGDIAILLGTASGFGTPANIPSGVVYPTAIVSGDFSGDGNIDLAVVGQTNGTAPGTLAILTGDGHGNFQAPVTIPAGVTPTALSAVDLNGDGKLDLVFSDSGPNGSGPGGGIYVALNTGTGVFQAPVQVFSGVAPTFGIGDVNGDGKLDLVVSSAVAGTGNTVLSWLAGTGRGTFQAPVVITTSSATDNAILVQDFNGDGHADIVIAHQDATATFLAGNGNGTFSAETPFLSTGDPTLLATADFNGDGKPDLIVGGLTMSVLLNKAVPIATVVSAANPAAAAIAPGSLATAYGKDLANKNAGGTSLPLPTSFGGTSISILDSTGTTSLAPLLYVSPGQVNFEVPPGVATGAATVTVVSGDGTQTLASVQIAPVAPGLFELNSAGLAAAYVILYHANGTQTVEQVYKVTGGDVVATPVSLGSSTDKPYLFLFGTGFEAAGTAGVKVSIGGTNVPVSFAGSQGGFAGLDQANVELPASLAGKGKVTIKLTAEGLAANAVNITIQ